MEIDIDATWCALALYFVPTATFIHEVNGKIISLEGKPSSTINLKNKFHLLIS